ncbi:MAG: Ku protein, partial [Caldimonas sp.]
DEEKKRILAAIDEKIAGKEIVANEPVETTTGAQVIDLVEALRASLGKGGGAKTRPTPAKATAAAKPAEQPKERKGVKRAPKSEETVAPARVRAKK